MAWVFLNTSDVTDGSAIGGTIAGVNDALGDEPELVNGSPYEDGWLVRISPEDPRDLDELQNADDYLAAMRSALEECLPADDPRRQDVLGIGVDFTASSPMPSASEAPSAA